MHKRNTLGPQKNHSPFEASGIEVKGETTGEIRGFSLRLYMVQPQPDDYAAQAQDASGAWASITVAAADRIEMVVIG